MRLESVSQVGPFGSIHCTLPLHTLSIVMTREHRRGKLFQMARPIAAFLWLTRPIFLLSGVVLYALGGQVARYQGVEIDWEVYLLGQLAVTAVQLVGQYVNEYFDVETDRLAAHRTLFSGGSGVLSAGVLPRRVALIAALVCGAIGISAMVALAVSFDAVPLSWLVFLLALAGAWAYSGPPVSLESSGIGELTTSLIVALLVPSMAYTLQTASISLLVVLAAVPLVSLHWAMVVAFEFPDYDADRKAGKRTVLVRLGHKRTASLHLVTTMGAFGLLIASTVISVPWTVAAPAMAMLPFAGVVVFLVRKAARGEQAPYGWLTFGAVSLFAITASLQAIGFYVASRF